MSQCNLCNNLKKKNEDDFRLAFDFVLSELVKSTKPAKCLACEVVLDGILRFEENSWEFSKDVARVYAYGLAKQQDSLSLALYFRDDRPKLVLEFYHRPQEMLQVSHKSRFILFFLNNPSFASCLHRK